MWHCIRFDIIRFIFMKRKRVKTYQLTSSHGFPKIKIGRQYLIPEEEFNKWEEKYCYKKYIL